MKFIWEREDIQGGRKIVAPTLKGGTEAIIAWNGLSEKDEPRRWTIVETSTDGRVHGQHKPATESSECVWESSGQKLELDPKTKNLIWVNFTKEELVDHLNNYGHQWIPLVTIA